VTTDTAISQRAAAVLAYVGACRIPPTIREIGDACGISSTSLVSYYLDELTNAGLIERSGAPGSSRNILVVKDGNNGNS